MAQQLSRQNSDWRRWARQGLSLGLIASALVVLGLYWLQRGRAPKTPSQPRLRLSIRESAHGFELSRSIGNRTLFRLRAGTAVQMRTGKNAAILRQVTLQIFQSNGQRADQIYCQRLHYQPGSGQVTTQGLVRMDVGGQLGPARPFGQPPAAEQGNPIHIEAHNLAFNTKQGIGQMRGGLSFRYLQAQGQAGRADWTAHPVRLVLGGQVRMQWQPVGRPLWKVRAERAILNRANASIRLLGGPGQPVRISQNGLWLQAPSLTLHLRPDYSIRRIVAVGGLQGGLRAAKNTYSWQARQGTVWLRRTRPPHPVLAHWSTAHALPSEALAVTRALLSGAVRLRHQGPGQHAALRARQLGLSFAAANRLEQARALGHAILMANQAGVSLPAKPAIVRKPSRPEARPQSPGLAWNLQSAAMPLLPAPGRGVRWRLRAPQIIFNFAASSAASSPGVSLPQFPHPPAGPASPNAAIGKLQLQRLSAPQARLLWQAQGRPPAHAQAQKVRMGFYASGKPQWLHARGHVILTTQEPVPHGRRNKPSPPAWRRDEAGLLRLRFDPNGQLSRWRETGNVWLTQSAGLPTHPAETEESIRADGLSQAAPGRWLRIWADSTSPYTHGQVLVMDPQLRLRTPWLKVQPSSKLTVASQPVSLVYLPGSNGGRGLRGIASRRASDSQNRLPVYLTAHGMQLHPGAEWVLFTGGVRLWQGADLITANRIILDRAHATLDAGGLVTSVFQPPAREKPAPAAVPRPASSALPSAGQSSLLIRSQSLHYAQRQAWARYQGHVRLTSGVNRLMAPELTLYFSSAHPGGAKSANGPAAIPMAAGALRLQRAVASGGVHMQSGDRHGQAANVVYDLVHNLITLRGGSPSIFDAELGFLTGRSLTFSPLGDTIRVESWANSRLYTAYRIASHPLEKK